MTVQQRFLLSTVEEVNHGLTCALTILEAIHMTMEQNEGPKTYLNALFGLWDYIDRLNDELKGVIEAVYAEQSGQIEG